MSEIKTSRPFQERFLDGYGRHELRQDIQKVKPSKFRKKTASWALGASLALTGFGIPITKLAVASHSSTAAAQPAAASGQPPSESASTPGSTTASAIAKDLATAQNIAHAVTGGVTSAVQDVAQVATQAPAAAEQTPSTVVTAVASATEAVKQHFFRTEVPFGQIIYQEAQRNELPPELLAAVVNTESKFMPNARSQAGAVGLMQLVPRTGHWLGAHDLTNPSQNVTAGAKYLRYLTDRFGGDTQKAVAAYNAGEGTVRRFGGIPPYRETQEYVSRVADYQEQLGQRIAGHEMGE